MKKLLALTFAMLFLLTALLPAGAASAAHAVRTNALTISVAKIRFIPTIPSFAEK